MVQSLHTVITLCGCLTALGARVNHRVKTAPQLPTKPFASQSSEEAGFWVRDAEQAYFAPPSSMAGLDQNISHYFYALGPKAALSADHLRSRVGGTGHVHLFYLPEGPAFLENRAAESAPASRSASLSELHNLKAGAFLGNIPDWVSRYELSPDYVDPLNSAELAVEKEMVAALTDSSFGDYLRTLTDADFGDLQVSGRNAKSEEEINKVVLYLENEFKSLGVATCVHTFKQGFFRSYDVHNVIGFVQGTEPGVVVLGAHYDSLPGSGAAPGAVDNGSGTAGVLASLKAFMAVGAKPKKSVYFVAFGGEEQGLHGSEQFASELKRAGSGKAPIPAECLAEPTTDVTALTMDMIGWRNPKFVADTVLLETRGWCESILQPLAKASEVTNGNRLELLYTTSPAGSDHMSFLTKGIPATLSIDNAGQPFAYSCYHKSCDTADNVDNKLAGEIARMNLGGLIRIARLD